MKKITMFAAAAGGLALSAVTSQAQLEINSNGSDLTINANNVLSIGTFNVSGDSLLTGSFGGTFQINTPATLNGALWTSTITGTQGFRIDTAGGDANGFLTATVTLISINTAGGINNPNVQVNLANIHYTAAGSGDADLEYLASNTVGELELTTQVNYTPGAGPGGNGLWTTGNPTAATYSGQIQPVPEANTVVAGALMLLPLGIGAVRALRKERVA